MCNSPFGGGGGGNYYALALQAAAAANAANAANAVSAASIPRASITQNTPEQQAAALARLRGGNSLTIDRSSLNVGDNSSGGGLAIAA